MIKHKSLKTLGKFYARLRHENMPPYVHSDFSRLARMIRGLSEGLFLVEEVLEAAVTLELSRLLLRRRAR